ncbi:MAG: hypothetical protein H8E44_29965 [Planctomycetes bacterium]|nr:hypothetical protein [Planctomycetota bacterium]
MKHDTPPTRRQFLAAAAATAAGSILLPHSSGLAATDGDGKTDHFLYRLAPPDGPYIDTQRDNKAFACGDREVLFSEDNAKTWAHSADFADAENIMFSSILGNGNIVFATLSKIYVSTDNLKTYRELIVKDRDGSAYLPHTPSDPKRPGSYFYSLDGIHTVEVDGGEMLIWGNYCNVRHGAAPSNIYYSTDQGETVKIAYSFGQNPHFQQKDADPATFLGDPDNPVLCRHVHSVAYNPAEKAFYACTGDLDRRQGHGLECHWLRGTYDAAADSWDWQVQVSSDANSRYKSGGINFVDGQVYWVADANGPKGPSEPYDRGIFRCDPADLADKARHTRIFPAKYELAAMTIDDRFIVVPEYGGANPCDTGFIFSPDLGKTWAQYDLKEFGDRSGVRVNPRNSDGWFRLCLRERWMNRAEVLFIKPIS